MMSFPLASLVSLPSRGAWIEIWRFLASYSARASLPSRGAWIEIFFIILFTSFLRSRSPHGERGLKSRYCPPRCLPPCRSPHGERGLKLKSGRRQPTSSRRSPHGERGLKCTGPFLKRCCFCRSPHGERGLKLFLAFLQLRPEESLPSRGAWIEMPRTLGHFFRAQVAPLTGSVD